MGKKSQIETIQDEARDEYDMRARLAKSNRRHKRVTVYTDEVLGEELGSAVDETYFDGIDSLKTGRRIRKGLIGELDALKERAAATLAKLEDAPDGEDEGPAAEAKQIETEITALNKKISALLKKLEKSAMTFNLHSVPDEIIKGARRKARQHLGIKKKGIPEDLQEEYNEEYACQMLSVSVADWEDKLAGEKFTSLGVQQARDLQGLLPAGQFPRLDAAMVELSFEASIANAAVDNVDF